MSSRIRLTISLLLLALVATLALAACGGGGSSAPDVPPGSIAIVGDKPVTKAEFDQFMEQQKKAAESKSQTFPDVGTPEYEAVKANVVKGLVEEREWELEGEAMGIKVTDEEIEKQLTQLKQQFFQGDEEKYKAELAKQGLTDEEVRDELRTRILSSKIFAAVTKSVNVSEIDINNYYKQNSANYQQPESREVRHILVKSKAQAEDLYNQIKAGASFAALAKKYTQDQASKANGGKFTAYQGRTVAPFDQFVFSAKTGELSQPIKTEFGWHIIQVLSPEKPATETPLSKVHDSIKTTLTQQKQNTAMKDWIANLRSKYGDQIAYAPGYAPAAGSTGTGTLGTTSG
ncbi:MAG TPA: peptidylprolyl isomerase [Gaiellaceae bacterium]|jgi:foldase protein PrsA